MLALFKKHRYTKDISFGVVDVHTHKVEEEPVVEQRLRQALETIPDDAIWVDPDCGLKTRTVEEAIAKLQSVAIAARTLRNSHRQ
jgi:5-methyltetrahydropteroyltriglutamate--homocysteine methyltransferase